MSQFNNNDNFESIIATSVATILKFIANNDTIELSYKNSNNDSANYNSTVNRHNYKLQHIIQLFIIIFYACLFTIGIIGNLSIFIYLSFKIWQSKQRNRKISQLVLYILSLSIIDTIALSSLPFTLTFWVTRRWPFGWLICKYYFAVLESANKICSPLILCAVSFNRYLGVCRPMEDNYKQNRFARRLIFVIVIVTLAVMSPAMICASTTTTSNGTTIGCYSYAECPDWLAAVSLVMIFVASFVIPYILMTFFYSRLRLTLSNRAEKSKRMSMYLKPVTKNLIILCMFYAGCFVPYWISSLTNYFRPGDHRTQFEVYLSVSLQSLPYVNGAMNCVLYAKVARNLLQSESSRRNSNRSIRSDNTRGGGGGPTTNGTYSTGTGTGGGRGSCQQHRWLLLKSKEHCDSSTMFL